MIAHALRSGARATGGLALAVLAACSNTPAAPHGPPLLTGVYWVSGDSRSLVWTPAAKADVPPSAPPFVSEIDFVFDRRLDGARIEDTFTVAGVEMTRAMTDPPVHVTWPSMPPGFSYTVQYNSIPQFGGDTSYVFLRPSAAGLPSGQTVTFTLDGTRLANTYGEGLTSPASVSVLTSALTVSASAPSAAVAGTYQLALAFSNRMSLSAPVSAFIHVRAGGHDVPYALNADANVSSIWYVAPADCLGRWPAGTTFTVVVDPGLPDAFGGKLSLGATTTFTTSAGAEATADCGVTTGGDAGDAGPDAPSDADAGDAVDAAVDGAGSPDAGGEAAGPAAAGADAAGAEGGAADVAAELAPDGGVPSDAQVGDATASS